MKDKNLLKTGVLSLLLAILFFNLYAVTAEASANKSSTVIAIDSPKINSDISTQSITVSGWAVSKNGIKQVKVYFDGKHVGNAKYGLKRADIKKAYPTYKNSSLSGYSLLLDMAQVSNGKHTITIEAIDNGGRATKVLRTINYKSSIPKVFVYNSLNLSTDLLSYTVQGWAISFAGIEKINVYLNGSLNGQALINGASPDVAKAFPEYPNSDKAKFAYTFDMRNLGSGVHIIKFEVIGKDGNKKTSTVNLNYNRPLPKIVIEKPALSESQTTSLLKVSGWVLSPSGIQNIGIYINDTLKVYGKTNVARQELSNFDRSYFDAVNGGFDYDIDIELLPIGKHELKIVSESFDGSTHTVKTYFNMIGVVEYVKYDNPLSYYVQRQFDKGSNKVHGRAGEATYEELTYYMDPGNFINDDAGKYMFLKLNYIEGILAEDLNKVLQGKGVLDSKGQAFIDAGKKFNINPIYLVAHSLLESGNGTSRLSNGVEVAKVKGLTVEPKVTYNVYGVGAHDNAAVVAGSEYAYEKGWFTVEEAIIGGAAFISEGYIQSDKYKQNTLYKMKWNFEVLWHEYATDIGWASKQTTRIKALVDMMDNPVLIFEVPVFSEK